jgi:hypothetical protein
MQNKKIFTGIIVVGAAKTLAKIATTDGMNSKSVSGIHNPLGRLGREKPHKHRTKTVILWKKPHKIR